MCVQQVRHIAHKFESGWEVGVIKAFDKKGPHAGKFSVNYKDNPNWWTHSFLREGYGRYTAKAKLCFCKNNKRRIIIKGKHWFCCGS